MASLKINEEALAVVESQLRTIEKDLSSALKTISNSASNSAAIDIYNPPIYLSGVKEDDVPIIDHRSNARQYIQYAKNINSKAQELENVKNEILDVADSVSRIIKAIDDFEEQNILLNMSSGSSSFNFSSGFHNSNMAALQETAVPLSLITEGKEIGEAFKDMLATGDVGEFFNTAYESFKDIGAELATGMEMNPNLSKILFPEFGKELVNEVFDGVNAQFGEEVTISNLLIPAFTILTGVGNLAEMPKFDIGDSTFVGPATFVGTIKDKIEEEATNIYDLVGAVYSGDVGVLVKDEENVSIIGEVVKPKNYNDPNKVEVKEETVVEVKEEKPEVSEPATPVIEETKEEIVIPENNVSDNSGGKQEKPITPKENKPPKENNNSNNSNNNSNNDNSQNGEVKEEPELDNKEEKVDENKEEPTDNKEEPKVETKVESAAEVPKLEPVSTDKKDIDTLATNANNLPSQEDVKVAGAGVAAMGAGVGSVITNGKPNVNQTPNVVNPVTSNVNIPSNNDIGLGGTPSTGNNSYYGNSSPESMTDFINSLDKSDGNNGPVYNNNAFANSMDNITENNGSNVNNIETTSNNVSNNIDNEVNVDTRDKTINRKINKVLDGNNESNDDIKTKEARHDLKDSSEIEETDKKDENDEKKELSSGEGVISGQSGYLIEENQTPMIIATGTTFGSAIVAAILASLEIISFLACILLIAAIFLLYGTFRYTRKKRKQNKVVVNVTNNTNKPMVDASMIIEQNNMMNQSFNNMNNGIQQPFSGQTMNNQQYSDSFNNQMNFNQEQNTLIQNEQPMNEQNNKELIIPPMRDNPNYEEFGTGLDFTSQSNNNNNNNIT